MLSIKNRPLFPAWVPQVESGARILIVGSSGGIGQALINLLLKGAPCVMGAHRSRCKKISQPSAQDQHIIIDLQFTLKSEEHCHGLVNRFIEEANGIDALVVLCGGISRSCHWKDLSQEEWNDDIHLNLSIPFFIARKSMKHMKEKGGRIILMGTESSLHGGSQDSLAYGVAKYGVECLIKGLAREGASYNILVNGIRPGFIKSGFHERWQNKTEKDLKKRAEMIPLQRGGYPEEIAAFIVYLLSGWSQFITGQMFAITGGDWL